jgi:hypothetical protein
MASVATVGEVETMEQCFERELARDRALLAFFNYGTLAASLFTVSTLLVLIIPLHRTSPWLVLLSLYAIATRLCVLVAKRALGVPGFLARLDDPDPYVAAAARTVLERHRSVLAKPLARLGTDDSANTAIDFEHVARASRDFVTAGWRRTGMACLAIWCVVTVAVITMLVVTRAGPTT